MHFCGVIVLPKNMKLEDARRGLGEALVSYNQADWYSVDNYRERLFPGETEEAPARQRVTLTELKTNFKHWAWGASAFAIFGVYKEVENIDDEEYYMNEMLFENEFYQFYKMEGRQELVDLYNKLYEQRIEQLIDALDESKYDVVLLDYHN